MKRPCGCGERGRHKPTCNLVGISKPIVKKEPRTCGCGIRGRHKPTCSLSDRAVPIVNEYEGKTDIHSLYYAAYGKPPTLSWYPNKERQRTVENRITKLVRRYKPFYLNTTSLDNVQEETWYIDGGNWVSCDDQFIGHVNNCLEFLDGNHPMWYNKLRGST